MDKTYQKKHELWMSITFASFAINDEEIKSRLYEFSLMAFRHMKWLGEEILAEGGEFNYDRNMHLTKNTNLFTILM
ncbi:MAG: iron-binding protein, partial [Campylobacterota bacterium]|nr:iron-binding protein [Campylobacterota bacterium]